jgi:hypothetical protein
VPASSAGFDFGAVRSFAIFVVAAVELAAPDAEFAVCSLHSVVASAEAEVEND